MDRRYRYEVKGAHTNLTDPRGSLERILNHLTSQGQRVVSIEDVGRVGMSLNKIWVVLETPVEDDTPADMPTESRGGYPGD